MHYGADGDEEQEYHHDEDHDRFGNWLEHLVDRLLDEQCCFFFFSSRRRHTRLTCDWSSTCALPISRFDPPPVFPAPILAPPPGPPSPQPTGTPPATLRLPISLPSFIFPAPLPDPSVVSPEIGRASCRERVSM